MPANRSLPSPLTSMAPGGRRRWSNFGHRVRQNLDPVCQESDSVCQNLGAVRQDFDPVRQVPTLYVDDNLPDRVVKNQQSRPFSSVTRGLSFPARNGAIR
jgi:hypothetical protein